MASKNGIFAIIDGISQKLEESFRGVSIYADGSETQGLLTPAFFISVLTPSRKPELGPRYRSLNPFDIHYFPAVDGNQAELLGIAEQLFTALEQVTVDGAPVRGTGMSYKLADGVLHFFVSYNLTGRKQLPDDTAMDNISLTSGIKE